MAGAFSVLSAIAEELGEELDPSPPDFEEVDEPLSGSLIGALDAWAGPTTEYERIMTIDLLGHLRLVHRRGRSLTEGYLDDVESLVGFRPATLHGADGALEELVEQAEPAADKRILHLLHRCAKRQRLLVPEMTPQGRPPGSTGPFVDRFRLEPVRSVMSRMS